MTNNDRFILGEMIPPQDGKPYYVGTCVGKDSGEAYPCWLEETIYMRHAEMPIVTVGAMVAVLAIMIVWMKASRRING